MLSSECAPVANAPQCFYIPIVPSALYSRDILRLAASIPHQARLVHPQASSEKRAPLCGSRIVVDVVSDGEGRIADFGLEISACALGQASASLMAARAIGRTSEDLAAARDALAAYLAGTRDDPSDWPGLAVFAYARRYPARHGAILLAFEAAAEAAALAAATAPAR